MFIRAGGATTPVSSDPLALALDGLQHQTDEGPCLSAARERPIVVAGDLASDERWPTFGAHAAQLGVRSAASYQLFLRRNDGDRLGALNLYGDHPDASDGAAVELGEVFAVHCSTVLAAAIAQEGLQTALESRDLIGQAKGILMAGASSTRPRRSSCCAKAHRPATSSSATSPGR